MRTLSNLKDLTILVWNVEGHQVQTNSKQRYYIFDRSPHNEDLKILIHRLQGI